MTIVPQADLLSWLDYEPPKRLIDTDDLARRFWAKVDRSGRHWLWTASLNVYGYGRFAVMPGVIIGAHRVAWVLQHGPIPRGLFVLHKCDTPPCVRHLFLGTCQDNTDDMMRKGRHGPGGAVGYANSRTKLTPELVAAIRGDYAMGDVTQESLGRKYGMTQGHISKVILNSSHAAFCGSGPSKDKLN